MISQLVIFCLGSLLSLALPLGGLAIVAARDADTRLPVPFDAQSQELVECLSALAAAALISYVRAESRRQAAPKLEISVREDALQEQVAQIAEGDFFNDLQSRLSELRSRKRASARSAAAPS